MKKAIIASLAVAAAGIFALGALPATAGVNCRTPGSDNTFLASISAGIRINCADSGGLNATATAPAGTSTSVSTNLLTGDQSQSTGFNASRLSVCTATDTTTSGTVTVSCSGSPVVFHNLFAENN